MHSANSYRFFFAVQSSQKSFEKHILPFVVNLPMLFDGLESREFLSRVTKHPLLVEKVEALVEHSENTGRAHP